MRLIQLLLATTWLIPTATAQTTWYVDASAGSPGTGTISDPFQSIQPALNAAINFDRILVAPGTYVENLNYFAKRVTLEATAGALETELLPMNPLEPTVQNGASFSSVLLGFTVRGGDRAIFADYFEGLTVERCIVRDNFEGLVNLWDMRVRNCNVVGNSKGLGHFGGGHGNDAITYVCDSVFWDNDENWFGFGLDCGNNLCVEFTVVRDPLFFGGTDHHIQLGSPCINAGDPTKTDPDGSRLDSGVLPYDPNYPSGSSYCTPTANTSGGRAVISISGSTSLAANDLVVAATRTPVDSSGLFFIGTAQVELPLGDGVVCAGGQIGRLPLTPTGPSGVPVYDFDIADVPGHVPPILPGEGRGLQYWFRDPLGGSSGWNYSNAVWVVFTP